MSRRALTVSLVALVLVAGVLAPRLRQTFEPAAIPEPFSVAVPEVPAVPVAPIAVAPIPEIVDAPVIAPTPIIPEATEPAAPRAVAPQIVLPPQPISAWEDGCPACGMG
jgi:hypothetical protein